MNFEEWITYGDGANGLALIDEVKTDTDIDALLFTLFGAQRIHGDKTCCMDLNNFDTEEDFRKAVNRSREIASELIEATRNRIKELEAGEDK